MNMRSVILIIFLSSTVTACDILCPPEPEEDNRKTRTDSVAAGSQATR
jgi:hypothetical protein